MLVKEGDVLAQQGFEVELTDLLGHAARHRTHACGLRKRGQGHLRAHGDVQTCEQVNGGLRLAIIALIECVEDVAKNDQLGWLVGPRKQRAHHGDRGQHVVLRLGKSE
eukprot:CAMPEP_0182594884 /NCGR_PEP_ID=MMETSP1324-20130603/81130_1 /TAXON_ID=236786 /ORGANISM="Florenciella sp., Strain RCC1587" /LENGTH=107 /DNA_ID=CAMNT_0024812461 /DNA_START=1 /DNA_END=324 /DNA_ORIENTATION=+